MCLFSSLLAASSSSISSVLFANTYIAMNISKMNTHAPSRGPKRCSTFES